MRRLRAALVTAAAVLVLLTLGAAPALAFDRQANESTMLQLINHARTSRGLHALSVVRRAARGGARLTPPT